MVRKSKPEPKPEPTLKGGIKAVRDAYRGQFKVEGGRAGFSWSKRAWRKP